jgi:hypothetical protein
MTATWLSCLHFGIIKFIVEFPGWSLYALKVKNCLISSNQERASLHKQSYHMPLPYANIQLFLILQKTRILKNLLPVYNTLCFDLKSWTKFSKNRLYESDLTSVPPCLAAHHEDKKNAKSFDAVRFNRPCDRVEKYAHHDISKNWHK